MAYKWLTPEGSRALGHALCTWFDSGEQSCLMKFADELLDLVPESIVPTSGEEGTVGPQGPAGPAGPEGPTGPAGADGADGEDGAQGPEGPAGPQGPIGPTGLTGPAGSQGIQGPAGEQGPQGIQGVKGDTGDTGPEGPQGEQGLQGIKGDTGDAGPAGDDGADGAPGADGSDGLMTSVVAGDGISVDSTDPANPVVSVTGGGGGGFWNTSMKPAAESRTSNITLQADSHLKFPMLANEWYAFRMVAFVYISDAAADFKWRHSGPAGASYIQIAQRQNNANASTYTQIGTVTGYSASNVVMSVTAAGAGTVWLEGMIENGPNAGDFEFQWAQNASTANPVFVTAGSYIEYKQIS